MGIPAGQVTDLSPLRGLTQLTDLTVDGQGSFSTAIISDLSPLSGLTGLKTLTLNDDHLVDLSPLAGLDLTSLDISNNQVTTVAPLARLAKLTTLHADGNQITDLSPLDGIAGLTTNTMLRQTATMAVSAGQAFTLPAVPRAGDTLTWAVTSGQVDVSGDQATISSPGTATLTWTNNVPTTTTFTGTLTVTAN